MLGASGRVRSQIVGNYFRHPLSRGRAPPADGVRLPKTPCRAAVKDNNRTSRANRALAGRATLLRLMTRKWPSSRRANNGGGCAFDLGAVPTGMPWIGGTWVYHTACLFHFVVDLFIENSSFLGPHKRVRDAPEISATPRSSTQRLLWGCRQVSASA